MALALFGFSVQTHAEIRASVSPWRRVALETESRWTSLARWSRSIEAGRLWTQPLSLPAERAASEVAATFIRSLLALSPLVPAGPIREYDAFLVAHSGGWVV